MSRQREGTRHPKDKSLRDMVSEAGRGQVLKAPKREVTFLLLLLSKRNRTVLDYRKYDIIRVLFIVV